ncbi:MAG: phosphate ABC transporter substrate-binding protein PstS [Thaumarchaeota archaeon]|nr:phosphate ABC transporter substrate-binding protein PstS [Nitrososphaerota archaeon]
MARKIILGLALTLILLMPTTAMVAHAQLVQTPPTTPPDGVNIKLNGAGSTFVFPIMSKWRVMYNGLYPGVSINYQSVGSGAGINQMTKKTVDFGASDAPLSPSQQKAAPNTLTFVDSIGAITVSYNIPNGKIVNGVDQIIPSGLKLDGPTIANIFEGKVIHWNDPAIQATNPGMSLPDARITVIHRSDGSGTTYAFTNYLSKVSSTWSHDVGQGTVVPWRTGIGGPGNAGVAHYVQLTPYSIGYVELAYAQQNHMSYAYVKNADGDNFVAPTIDSTSATASTITNLPASNGDWSKVSITNAPGPDSYPIASLTYIMAYQNREVVKGTDLNRANALLSFIYWIVTDGQQHAKPLWYVPLPQNIQLVDINGLQMFKYKGQQLWDDTG